MRVVRLQYRESIKYSNKIFTNFSDHEVFWIIGEFNILQIETDRHLTII